MNEYAFLIDEYVSIITYKSGNGDDVTIEHRGFNSVKEATSWMLEKVGYLVLHWGEINENGLKITAEVFSDSFGFSDTYDIRCGC